MKLPHPLQSFFYLLLYFGLILGGMSFLVEVNIRDTAIFTCNETCNRHPLWTFNTVNENLDVLKCVQESCTEGDNFKNRVRLQPGALSLSLYPVLYNDEGWYMVICDSKTLCRFNLKVLVPTIVSTSVRSNITLPCYARTEKQIADDAVNILWKKNEQTVLQVQKGITTYGSGFTDRASVSLPRYKDGDLSLNLLRVTTSDKGLYRCYHRTTEEHGYPGAVTLNVTAVEKFFAKKFGENLTLDLLGCDHVKVTFTSHDAAETLVCNVIGNYSTCSSDYSHRVSVINNVLVLHDTTTSDTGTFTVRDEMGELIGVNTVTVEDVTQRHHHIFLFVLSGFVLICLFLCYRCHRKSESQQYINPEPSREPACIGLSQQETNPVSSTHVRPSTPVENQNQKTSVVVFNA